MKRGIFIISFLLVPVACVNSNSHTAFDGGSSNTGQPALHAVHNEHLHNLMNRMNSAMQERFLTEPELDAERHKYAYRMSKAAQELVQTLDAVLTSSTTLQLSEAEKSTFQALAHKLHKQAQSLQEYADQNRMADISATLDQMSTTCISCHNLFRKE